MDKRSYAVLILALLVSSSVGGISAAPKARAEAATVPIIGETYGNFPPSWILTNGGQFSGSGGGFPYLVYQTVTLQGTLYPSVADAPYPVAGSNNTEWIMSTSSPNEKWSDGVPLNATDLAFSLQIYSPTGPYANLDLVAPFGGGIPNNLKNVSIINSTSILVTLDKPTIGFAEAAPLYNVYPWHYLKQFTGNDTLSTTPILSGPFDSPFIPVNYTGTGSTLAFKVNPDSPSWSEYGRTPTVSEIEIQDFTDTSSLVNALVAGTIDLAQIPYSDLSTVQSTPSLTAVQIPAVNVLQLEIKSAGGIYNSTSFRQALLDLVNQSEINQALYNGAGVSGNAAMIPPADTTFVPGNLPQYAFNTATATQLFTQAGVTKDSQGQLAWANGTVIPPINLQVQNDDPAWIRAGQIISAAWQAAGVPVSIQTVTPTQINDEAFTSFQYDAILYTNFFFPNPFRYIANGDNWGTGGGQEWTNSTFEQDQANAQASSNITVADSWMNQAETVLAQNAITDAVVYYPTYVAYNNQVLNNLTAALQQEPSVNLFAQAYSSAYVLTALSLRSAGTSSSTTTSSSATTSSVTITSSGPSTSSSTTTTPPIGSTTSTSTTSGSGASLAYELAAAVAVVVVVAIAATFALRRRPATNRAAPPAS
jgi:ABC-type transport system substrate-binding protein